MCGVVCGWVQACLCMKAFTATFLLDPSTAALLIIRARMLYSHSVYECKL